jgi:hypothetical protein
MKVVKQRFARQLNEKCRRTAATQGELWGKRVRRRLANVIEKLRYIHRNPVKRGVG